MMNQTANIALLVAALLDMIVLLCGDITAHRDNGHNNSRYYAWLNKSGELLSPKRLLLLAVFIATFTTMALQSWIVVMLLAALLLAQSIVLLSSRQWKLMASDKRMGLMLAVDCHWDCCPLGQQGQRAFCLTHYLDGRSHASPHHAIAHHACSMDDRSRP